MIITRRGFLKLSGAALLAIALPEGSAAAAFRIPVLTYHHIGEPAREYETVAPAQFAAQMEWLYAEGYRAISVAGLATLPVRDGDKVVLITADDGHLSFLDHAFYLLREYGFHATVTVIGRYVGGFVHENRPRLSWDECRYLMQSGLVEIGCHSYNLHEREGLVSPAATLAGFNQKLEEDLGRFQQIYTREMGKSADILAWPYGIYDQQSIAIARKAGFKYLLNSDGRYVERENDRSEIPRLAVHNRMDLEKFRSMFERRA
jgi:peptidoglycan/xylan/chitin deacetylase (PgdA/CDA1 family)